jgi:hypothetical protein
MPQYVTPEEMYERLMDLVRKSPDIGLKKATLNRILEPPNPFTPEATRRPAPGFVLTLLFLAAILGTFLYFNLRS